MATSLTETLKAHRRAHITWVTEREAFPLLLGHPTIDQLIEATFTEIAPLRKEHFDMAINLDRSPLACSTIMEIAADVRVGFGQSRRNVMMPLNSATETLFDINRFPDFRSNNLQSWSDIYHSIAGFKVGSKGPPPSLHLSDTEKATAAEWREEIGVGRRRLIVSCLGSHQKDTQKRWPLSHWCRLWETLAKNPSIITALHGGPHEQDICAEASKVAPLSIIRSSPVRDLRASMARLYAADVVITGDSLALHIAMALNRRVVALFGPTNLHLVQNAVNCKKLRGSFDCPPCHSRTCSQIENQVDPRPCLTSIDPAQVADCVMEMLHNPSVT